MKKYIPRSSGQKNPNNNRYDVCATTNRSAQGQNEFAEYESSQEEFLKDITDILEKKLKLSVSSEKTGQIQTVQLYLTPNGKILEIANDDFMGYVAESEDRETIGLIFEHLKSLQG